MQNIWLIIVVFFLIFLIIPIVIKIYASYNLLDNLGVISLYIFCLRIVTYKVRYQNKQIIVFSQKNAKDIPVQLSEKKLRFIEQLTSQMKNKIILKNVTIFSRIGVRDAFNTALLMGFVSSIIGSIIGMVRNKREYAKFELINLPEYNGSFFTISTTILCHITIFDILYALFISFLIVQRSEKYERI